MPELRRFIGLCAATAIGLALSTGLFSAQAQERELKVGYMKNPIQDASLDMMETWAKAHGVKLTRGSDHFDLIWHNDDYDQLWKKLLHTSYDLKGINDADRWLLVEL